MYRACIFDLDGTLTDTLESLTYSVNETLKELALPAITSEQCRRFVGDGARALIERTMNAVGANERTEEAVEVYRRVFALNCTYHVKPYEGILPMLDSLRNLGVRTAVLSNKPHLQTVDVVEQILGGDRFDRIAGQREQIARKPDPAGVYQIMEDLEILKEDCLYIGDSDVDMETAKRAGIVSVGVTWGFRPGEVLRKAGACHIIDRPEELWKIVTKA